VLRFGGSAKALRVVRFERALLQALRPKPERLIAHMAPVYAVLAAPIARPAGVRTVLWFTHWRATAKLRLAEHLVNRIATVDARTVPLHSGKVIGIGHSIDVSEFPISPRGDGLRVTALGRTSPTKGLETIIRAVARVDGATLEMRGPSLTDEERRHRSELEQLAASLGAPVQIGDAVPRSELPALFARTDVLVNNNRAGTADKVVYEAAASGVPVLASSPAFDDFLDPFPAADPAELARLLTELGQTTPAERTQIGEKLRKAVVERHSIESWATRMLEV
jgi:glycosyltransferase involved in cell wall biosynthesis